ncbi:MAG TPA: nodulation protein NfeD [Xanthobacteraceae bacterium]|nr:nodulation protein NfeD [Xanthobacteraceae bacterium]
MQSTMHSNIRPRPILAAVGLWHRCAAAILLAAAVVAFAPSAQSATKRALVLEIDGAIGPASADYVVRELEAAKPSEVGIIILRMNTPGGLDTSMRTMIKAILASPTPVATFVAPRGARAASAGTYIAYASAIAAMAPGTNIGAATPIQLGAKQPAPADTETRKIINDAAAYIRSLADLSGRNADWAVDAVRTAASIPASEALKLHVIDAIADDVPDLLRQIDGRAVKIAGRPETLATAGLAIATVHPDWRTDLLAIITDPNVAFILMMIGVYGLIFEFLSPGTVVPGLVGVICLVVALYALNFLPIDYAGAGLTLLGAVLLLLEAHIGAFGAIGFAGIVAFVVGALMMFPSRVPGFGLSPWVVADALVVAGALFVFLLAVVLRSRRRVVMAAMRALLGAEGEALSWQGQRGRISIKGATWRARAAGPLRRGARVKVIDRDGLVLVVEPA